MSAIVGPIITALEGALSGASNAGSSTESIDVAIQDIDVTFVDFAKGILFVFGQVHGAWIYVQDDSKQIGHDFEQIQGDVSDTIDHVVNDILPASLARLRDELKQDTAKQKPIDLGPIRKAIAALQKDMQAVDDWENSKAKPELSKLLTWQADVIKHDIPAVKELIGWLAKPGTFGKWAAPPILSPLVAELKTSANRAIRDSLALALVQSWQNDPLDIWSAIESWLVKG